MPTTARVNREADDAEAGAAQAENCKKVRVTLPVLSVLQMVLQHAAEAFADKSTELSDVLTPINNPVLRKVNWKSNPGNVIEALLHACGLGWSPCGKKLWRRADPTKVVEWRPPQKGRSLRPAAPRATTLDALDDDELQHESVCRAVRRERTGRRDGDCTLCVRLVWPAFSKLSIPYTIQLYSKLI